MLRPNTDALMIDTKNSLFFRGATYSGIPPQHEDENEERKHRQKPQHVKLIFALATIMNGDFHKSRTIPL
jgi:hypothetical protein